MLKVINPVTGEMLEVVWNYKIETVYDLKVKTKRVGTTEMAICSVFNRGVSTTPIYTGSVKKYYLDVASKPISRKQAFIKMLENAFPNIKVEFSQEDLKILSKPATDEEQETAINDVLSVYQKKVLQRNQNREIRKEFWKVFNNRSVVPLPKELFEPVAI